MTQNSNQTNLPFTDRASYIAWVKEWKANYKSLSEMIRQTKRDIRDTQKAGNHACSMQASREYMRKRARDMLTERQESKVQAQAQYMAERETKAAA